MRKGITEDQIVQTTHDASVVISTNYTFRWAFLFMYTVNMGTHGLHL